mmetsp:Transcript_16628/g.27751  ORF Transcript_16628/g.27751 Transcript_16628/m.27751 type:complete len:207 (+) Transcript_16628:4329-4949(+)
MKHMCDEHELSHLGHELVHQAREELVQEVDGAVPAGRDEQRLARGGGGHDLSSTVLGRHHPFAGSGSARGRVAEGLAVFANASAHGELRLDEAGTHHCDGGTLSISRSTLLGRELHAQGLEEAHQRKLGPIVEGLSRVGDESSQRRHHCNAPRAPLKVWQSGQCQVHAAVVVHIHKLVEVHVFPHCLEEKRLADSCIKHQHVNIAA